MNSGKNIFRMKYAIRILNADGTFNAMLCVNGRSNWSKGHAKKLAKKYAVQFPRLIVEENY